MDISTTATVTGVSIALLGQASVFAFFLGKQTQRIDSEKELNGVKFDNNKGEHLAILKATEKHTEILEEVQECMHKMQGGKDCD